MSGLCNTATVNREILAIISFLSECLAFLRFSPSESFLFGGILGHTTMIEVFVSTSPGANPFDIIISRFFGCVYICDCGCVRIQLNVDEDVFEILIEMSVLVAMRHFKIDL